MQLCSKLIPDSETGCLLTEVDPQPTAAWKSFCILTCCLPRHVCNVVYFVQLPFALSPLPRVPQIYQHVSNGELPKVLQMRQLLLLFFAHGECKPILVTPTLLLLEHRFQQLPDHVTAKKEGITFCLPRALL